MRNRDSRRRGWTCYARRRFLISARLLKKRAVPNRRRLPGSGTGVSVVLPPQLMSPFALNVTLSNSSMLYEGGVERELIVVFESP